MARYSHFKEKDIQEIANLYNLRGIDFDPIEGGAGNSSFLLRTRQGNYVMTVFDDKTWNDVVKLGRLLLLLEQYEFPTTRLLLSKKGGNAVMHKGKPVMMKAYINGQVHQHLDRAMLHQVGTAMARLHQLPPPDFLPDKHPCGRQFFSTVIGQNVDPKYEAWLAERCTYLEQHLPSGLPRGLIHGDLFYDNVLFNGKEFKAIIDFEDACCTYKEFDLGMGILGLCTVGTALSIDKARELVIGYQKVRLLEVREKEALQRFVEYAAIATSYWRFWKYRIHTPLPAKANLHLQMVHLAEEIRAVPRARFLSEVFA
jgi:homoserine kinase type II